eukprot:1180745-Prorocentrum_minimum.AAC.4
MPQISTAKCNSAARCEHRREAISDDSNNRAKIGSPPACDSSARTAHDLFSSAAIAQHQATGKHHPSSPERTTFSVTDAEGAQWKRGRSGGHRRVSPNNAKTPPPLAPRFSFIGGSQLPPHGKRKRDMPPAPPVEVIRGSLWPHALQNDYRGPPVEC